MQMFDQEDILCASNCARLTAHATRPRLLRRRECHDAGSECRAHKHLLVACAGVVEIARVGWVGARAAARASLHTRPASSCAMYALQPERMLLNDIMARLKQGYEGGC